MIYSLTKLKKNQNNNIAIEIDFPNSYISLKQSKYPLLFDYEIIEQFALNLGFISSSRIYADWNVYISEKRYLSQFDVELINVNHILVMGDKKRKKDLVDTEIACNIGIMLCENPQINLIIIVSGDADFIPVIKRIKEYGDKRVIVIAPEKALSEHLGKYADYTFLYEFLAIR